jgi:hypothetical protein
LGACPAAKPDIATASAGRRRRNRRNMLRSLKIGACEPVRSALTLRSIVFTRPGPTADLEHSALVAVVSGGMA